MRVNASRAFCPHSVQISIIPLSLSLLSACGASPAHDLPSRDQAEATIEVAPSSPSKTTEPTSPPELSIQLSQSGEVKPKAIIPFVSGWDLEQNSVNIRDFLNTGKRRYVLSLCASWCKPCMKGLGRLSEAKSQFEATNTGLIIYVVRDTRAKAMELRSRFKLDWASTFIDEYGEHAKRLIPRSDESLTLPRTFVLNGDGEVQMIIGKEGDDFIDLLLETRISE